MYPDSRQYPHTGDRDMVDNRPVRRNIGNGTPADVEANIRSIMKAHYLTYDEAREMEIRVISGLIADDVIADRQMYQPWIDAYRYLTGRGN